MKKTIAAAMVMGVMAFGTTMANAGIIIIDKVEEPKDVSSGSCETSKDGIIIIDAILSLLEGIIIIDKAEEPCTDQKDTEGIIIID